jgi:predicted Zn-dependent peptidase
MIKTAYLENGICVVGEENNYVRTVSIGIWIKNGSIDEKLSNNGISHFIEHMLFKGTAKRSSRDIADEMAQVGGRINAFTSKEYMCYYAHIIDSHFDVALDVLSDMICHSKFSPEEIEKEKGVILDELKMCQDTPEDIINDKLQNAIWEGHPVSYDILGSEANIEAFERDEIKDYLSHHYVSDNMVISVVGKIDFDRVVSKLNKSFSSIKKSKGAKRDTLVPYKKSIVTKNKDIEQTHIILSLPTISYESEESYTLNVLNTLIGSGMNSRLFQSIREEKGLVYSIYSYIETYKHGGLFNIYGASSPDKIPEVVTGIRAELDKILKKGFNNKELGRTKEQIKSNMIIGLENMDARMSSYGKSKLVLDRIKSQDEIINGINNVTTEKLLEFANNLFDYKNMSVSLVGKLSDNNIEGIEKICIS